jgi:hypothetical protein
MVAVLGNEHLAPRQGEIGQAPEDKELPVYSAELKPKTRKTSNLYSTAIRASSEERLCLQRDGISVEIVEIILHDHGNDRFER